MAEVLDLEMNAENSVSNSGEITSESVTQKLEFEPIQTIPLTGSDIGSTINDRFNTINDNFEKISNSEYLRGSDGNNVKIIEVTFKLEDTNVMTKDEKPIYLDKSQVTGNDIATKIQDAIKALSEDSALASISNIEWDDNLKKVDQHISFIIEEENDIYNIKSSLWYVYNDPRFANPQDNPDYSGLFNVSCVVYYDGEKFVAHQPFPTLYYNTSKGFCWRINNQETSISAHGIKGKDGNIYSIYIAEYRKNDEDLEILKMMDSSSNTLVDINEITEEYDNCTAICFPSTNSTDTNVYIGVINKNKGNKAYIPEGGYKSLSEYVYAKNLDTLMENNLTEKNVSNSLFIPHKVGDVTYYHTFAPGGLGQKSDLTLSVKIKSEGNNPVANSNNLNIKYNNTTLSGALKVNGDTTLGDTNTDAVTINGTLNVKGDTTLGDATINTATITGPTTLNSTLNVNGNTTLGDANTDTVTINGTLNVKGDTTLGDTVTITGPTTLNSTLNVKGNATLGDASTDTVTIKGTLIAPNVVTKIEDIKYTALKTRVNNGKLVPGRKYRITDYVTTIPTSDYIKSIEEPFDIIVEALTSNTLSEKAQAVRHDYNDGNVHYFDKSKLEAWELKYDLNNNTRFPLANNKGTGVIYYMKDEFGNEAPYDFKNIMFKYELYSDFMLTENGGAGGSDTITITKGEWSGWKGNYGTLFLFTFTNMPRDTYTSPPKYTFNNITDGSLTGSHRGNKIQGEQINITNELSGGIIVFLNMISDEVENNIVNPGCKQILCMTRMAEGNSIQNSTFINVKPSAPRYSVMIYNGSIDSMYYGQIREQPTGVSDHSGIRGDTNKMYFEGERLPGS